MPRPVDPTEEQADQEDSGYSVWTGPEDWF